MFSKLFFVVFAIHCVFWALLNAQEADTLILTLTDCEKLAQENNLKVQNARYSIKIAEARKIQAAHLGILPKLELKHIWGPASRARAEFNEFGVLMSPDTSFRLNDISYFSETEFNLLQPLYTFGKLQHAKNAAEYGYLAEKANLEKVDEDVQFQIRELYWTLLLEKELLIVIEDAKKEIDKAETKIENKLDEI